MTNNQETNMTRSNLAKVMHDDLSTLDKQNLYPRSSNVDVHANMPSESARTHSSAQMDREQVLNADQRIHQEKPIDDNDDMHDDDDDDADADADVDVDVDSHADNDDVERANHH
jgi:hypothetical protein